MNSPIKDPEYQYKTDVIYHSFVDNITHLLLDKSISIDEIRCACELANEKYYELLMKECEGPN